MKDFPQWRCTVLEPHYTFRADTCMTCFARSIRYCELLQWQGELGYVFIIRFKMCTIYSLVYHKYPDMLIFLYTVVAHLLWKNLTHWCFIVIGPNLPKGMPVPLL